MKREDFYGQLDELYARLDQALPRHPGNPCGSCRECCTARGLTQHVVSQLELDYLAARQGPEQVEDFRAYAARERDAEGNYRFEVCPYYRDGCSVYPHRPFACRTFGHLRAAGTRLPEVCVFQGKEKVFEQRDYLQDVPQAREMHRLKREYLVWNWSGSTASRPGAGMSMDHLDPTDPVDRAWLHLFRGEAEAALQALLADPEPTPFSRMSRAVAFGGLGHWEEAAAELRTVLKDSPENPHLHYQLARIYLEAADYQRARTHLEETLRLFPRHLGALTYRGYLCLVEGQAEEGVEWLERSLAEVDQPEVRLRAGAACVRLGRTEQARTHLERAAAQGFVEATRLLEGL